MTDTSSNSVGLGGDGDEIQAIYDVEHEFGVKLDYDDAPGWVTAGDVFSSLQKVLPEADSSRPDLWERFANALSVQTGVDPSTIEKDSPLLSDSRLWAQLASASAYVWIVLLVGLFLVVAASALI